MRLENKDIMTIVISACKIMDSAIEIMRILEAIARDDMHKGQIEDIIKKNRIKFSDE